MLMLTNKKRSALFVALAVTALPLAAQAQRKSPLADAPAIRKRYELRSSRLEVGAGLGSTLNQDFYHTVLIDLKLGFHITDWLSVAAFGDFGVANIATGYQSKLTGSLNAMGNANIPREPTPGEAQASMQKISSILGAQLEFTPFTGKYSMFGKLFANYDFYAFVGPGFINVKPSDSSNLQSCSDTTTGFSCGVSGLKPGATFGVGLHSYFSNWIALNVELRDMLAQLNPSGRDVNGDGRANSGDLSWTHTYVLGANVVLYLPATPSISQ
jgi:outer membrane beta-barrel protein